MKKRKEIFTKNKRKKRILLIIEIILIVFIVITLVYLAKWFIDGKKTKKIQEDMMQYIKENKMQDVIDIDANIDNNIDSEIIIDFKELKKKNKDVKAWLKVNGTNIDLPIVQAKNNDYYVRTSLDRTYNFGGWPFFDFRNKLNEKDKNIIIYGHNMKNGTMFHDLRYSFDKKWYGKEENQIITLITPTETNKYKIFSMYKVPSEEYYITTSFTDSEYQKFLQNIKSRSSIKFKQEIKDVKQILTLSTCDYNLKNRIVIHAAKIDI